MYLKCVKLKDIRCISQIRIDLASPARTNKSILILGDNATGKTSILRAIAMGLCDEDGASGLLRDLTGDFIRHGASQGIISLTLTHGRRTFDITTTISKTKAGLETVKKAYTSIDAFPWKRLFVCGYGANRSMEGSVTYERYTPADAVYTLFMYDYPLQNPELAILRRLRLHANEERAICKQLAKILMLDSKAVGFTEVGLVVRAGKGDDVPLGALADGHQSTLTWLLDLMSWTYLAHPKARLTPPSGIVLIDELEQHLHPKWQRRILGLLAEQFPFVQFISTTHSMICAASVADLSPRRCTLERLTPDEKGVVTSETIGPMAGWRYDEILTSEAFGLPVPRGVKGAGLMDQLRKVYLKEKMSNEEERQFKNLLRRLERLSPVAAECIRDEAVSKSVRSELARLKAESSRR